MDNHTIKSCVISLFFLQTKIEKGKIEGNKYRKTKENRLKEKVVKCVYLKFATNAFDLLLFQPFFPGLLIFSISSSLSRFFSATTAKYLKQKKKLKPSIELLLLSIPHNSVIYPIKENLINIIQDMS